MTSVFSFSRLRSSVTNVVRGAPILRRNQLLGMDTDEALAYSTKKVVWIRDRYVGLCYYSLIAAVVLWVIGGQILWRNEHFLTKDVEGLARMWYSHPTLNNCDPTTASCKSNYTSLTDLEYCDEYRGPRRSGVQQSHCQYEDKLSLVPDGVTDNKLFFPTAVEVVTERRHCHPSNGNDYICDGKYLALNGSNCLHPNYLCRDRAGEIDQFHYVADIKNFKIRFTSSYARDDIRGTSLMHPAFLGVCESLLRTDSKPRTWTERQSVLEHNQCRGNPTLEKLPCEFGVDCAQMRKFDLLEDTGVRVVGEGISSRMRDLTSKASIPGQAFDDTALLTRSRRQGQKKSRKHHALLRKDSGLANERGHVSKFTEYSDNWGDVFTVGRLLQLAGADLDLDYNMDGWTTRQAGTVLEVRAVYNNLYPVLSTFGYKPVRYHYEINELMLPYVSRVQMSEDQPRDYPQTRRYEIQYGVLVHFRVAGSFGFFNLVYLLLMLTTAFALTATASTLTDLFFLYLSDQSDNFFHLKYEVSPDFSDMWRCDTCGFFNLDDHNKCQGVPKFMCPKTTAPCGAVRPLSSCADVA